jgi:hypothetical protein
MRGATIFAARRELRFHGFVLSELRVACVLRVSLRRKHIDDEKFPRYDRAHFSSRQHVNF